jgi:nucleoside-diphosphate-sugar epimerase
MKTALILGITGTFGGQVAAALQARGYALRALLRDPAKLPLAFTGTEVIQGDIGDRQALRRAADGVEVMVYGVNPPGYQWKGRALPWLENAASVAEERGLTLLFPGNVYVFDPADGPDFDEAAPLQPTSSLGRTRLAMEQRLKRAAEHGARVIIVRAGDFIAPGAESAWLQVLLHKKGDGYTLMAPGPRHLPHTWAYLPDLAQAAAGLLERSESLPAFNVFHYRGHRVSLEEIAEAARQASGRPVKLRAFPWWALRLAAPFSVMFRGLLEMRYLWRRQVNMDGARLEAALPEVVHTPLPRALLEAGLVQAGH